MRVDFHAMHKLGLSPYGQWGFLHSQALRRLMQNRGIGPGSSPIGNEGFAHPSARPKQSTTKSVLQQFGW